VDLHAHPDRDSSRYGVDPDLHFLTRGVTTVMSQGDAGANNWSRYRDNVIHGSTTRVRLAISLSAVGETNANHCLERPEDLDANACATTALEGGDLIWGIAVNSSEASCGNFDPREVLAQGLEAAEQTKRPLLFGSRLATDVSLAEQLSLLRQGDVLTYCYNAKDESLIENGKIRDCVRDARDCGVLFDIGHGMNSFSFKTAEIAIAEGFLPDTISTDQYRRHVDSDPQHDLPRTFSKLIAAGMTESDAFTRVTKHPAEILGLRGEVGTLTPGSCADLSVLQWNNDAAPLVDVEGQTRPGGCYEPITTIRAGRII
jgi:dihydroorotase